MIVLVDQGIWKIIANFWNRLLDILVIIYTITLGGFNTHFPKCIKGSIRLQFYTSIAIGMPQQRFALSIFMIRL